MIAMLLLCHYWCQLCVCEKFTCLASVLVLHMIAIAFNTARGEDMQCTFFSLRGLISLVMLVWSKEGIVTVLLLFCR